jgi:hypothetical protein
LLFRSSEMHFPFSSWIPESKIRNALQLLHLWIDLLNELVLLYMSISIGVLTHLVSQNRKLGHQVNFYLSVQHCGSRKSVYLLHSEDEATLVCTRSFYNVDNMQCTCCFHHTATDNYNGDRYILAYLFQVP